MPFILPFSFTFGTFLKHRYQSQDQRPFVQSIYKQKVTAETKNLFTPSLLPIFVQCHLKS